MTTTRTDHQIACDGVQAVWHQQVHARASTEYVTPSMDGVIAPDALAHMASEQHRRDIMQIARSVEKQGIHPLRELKKTMDGIHLPLKGYASAGA